ncbi:phosphotransferase family protein [Sphingopyxis sp. J-6]|uniref:phosphotransferase family protein n=1 Tax=Sphingopyxis sp. J-6 TaxID=3122054 RepID=UPI00398406C4
MDNDNALEASRAITGATQQGEDDEIGLRLENFLQRQTGLGGKITAIRLDDGRRSAGASSGTILFDAVVDTGTGTQVRRLVFRYDLGGAFFSQYSLPPQFEIMQALYARGLPVPRPLWLDAGGEVNGKPGLFMERIEGIAPSTMPFNEGPYMAVGAADRHRMLLEAARTLAAVHATSSAGLADDHFARRGGDGHYLDREIGWTLVELRRTIPPAAPGAKADFYRDIRDTLEKVADWLTAQAPRHRVPELAHGDANISNFMYDDAGQVVALLDWELAHHGVGEADLAYQIAGIAHFALLAPPVAGIPAPDEMMASYAQARGKLEDWDFAQVLGEWRLAVFASMGMSRLPPELEDVERTYWAASRKRLAALVPGIGA